MNMKLFIEIKISVISCRTPKISLQFISYFPESPVDEFVFPPLLTGSWYGIWSWYAIS